MFAINGEGQIQVGELIVTQTGATITQAGLAIELGGATISDDGLIVYSTQAAKDTVIIQSKNIAMTSNTLSLYSDVVDASQKLNFNLLAAGKDSSNILFKVRGDGNVKISEGGLDVIQGGATIRAAGLLINDGGATIMHTDPEGKIPSLTVKNGALLENSHVNATVLTVKASSDLHNGTALLIRSDAAAGADNKDYSLISAVINADGDNSATAQTVFRVSALPRTEVVSGGFVIQAGGQTVRAGGLVVTAGKFRK